MAGPIQRSEGFLSPLRSLAPVRAPMVTRGVQRILLGYSKKFVVADHLGLLVDMVYSHLHQGGTPLWLGYYAYPRQIFADFSGLTDIAVGSALLLGVESP